MRCDRCEEETLSFTMSYFNTELICASCDDAERAHPEFEKARLAELEAVASGDYNFQGVGLPSDLRGALTSAKEM